jgi:hypothetical protein
MNWIPEQPARDGIHWWREGEHAKPLLVVIRSGRAHLLRRDPEPFAPNPSGEWSEERVMLPEEHSTEQENGRNTEILIEALASKSPAINAWALNLLQRLEIRLEAWERREFQALEQQSQRLRDARSPN